MDNNWIGKAVSIHCTGSLGIFQGTIQNVSNQKITIIRAFRNGIPLKQPDMEITIGIADILKLDLIPAYSINKTEKINKPTPIKHPTAKKYEQKVSPPTDSGSFIPRPFKSPAQLNKQHFPIYLIPAKVETRMAGLTTETNNIRNVSKPIEIPIGSAFRSNGEKNKSKNRQLAAFSDPIDPIMDEDFDFEKNLALFDKQAIWDEIDSYQKPDLLKQTPRYGKYRHDENILSSDPVQCRRIEIDLTKYGQTEQFVSEDGTFMLPAIPMSLRDEIEKRAEACGLSYERQVDLFARSIAEMALQLLGGSRRLQANNSHQWPRVAIICDEPSIDKYSEQGLAVGRQLASQGLKVSVFTRNEQLHKQSSKELSLFKATGNLVTQNCEQLPTPDLTILAIPSEMTDSGIIKFMSVHSRSPVFAISPPQCGIHEINIKYSIFPILPISNTASACGKLYLANLSIPQNIYRDLGIKYKSPFGHKFVIPIHLKES